MIHLKKIVITLLSLSACISFAGTIGPALLDANNPKENMYFGAGVGGSFNRDQLNTRNVSSGTSVEDSVDNNRWVGNLFIGYGHTFDNSVFLALEANTYFPHQLIDFYSPGVTFIGQIFQNQYAIKDYLSLDLLPGYRPNSNLLVYGRVGLSFRDVSLNQPQLALDSPSFFDAETSVGGRFGAGVTYAFNKHIATSVDYYYSYFSPFTSTWPLFDLEYTMKSHANYIGFSLVYTS